MATISPNWGIALKSRLGSLGYGASRKLGEAVGRTPPTIQRWKDGEVPPAKLWPAIDEFFGHRGWTEFVVNLCREIDELDKAGPSLDRDEAVDLLGEYTDVKGPRPPLPLNDRDRLSALEREQARQRETLAGLQDLVEELLVELRGEASSRGRPARRRKAPG